MYQIIYVCHVGFNSSPPVVILPPPGGWGEVPDPLG